MTPRRFASGIASGLALAILTFAVAACGTRQLVLSVDLLSFISPADRDTTFSTPVLTPVAIDTTYTLVNNQRMTLFQGLNNVTDSPSVDLNAALQVQGTRDSADATLNIYLAADGQNPRSTTALFSTPVRIRDGQTQTVTFALSSLSLAEQARVADLVTHSAVQVAVDIDLSVPAFTQPAGKMTLTQLEATVRADRPKL